MLRPPTTCVAVILAVALCAGSPAVAQGSGLSERLDAAEKQLDTDIDACKKIDMAVYDALLSQANRNLDHAKEMAATSKLPIDLERLEADKGQAEALRERASQGKKRPCVKATFGGGGPPVPKDQDTKVEPPALPKAEVYPEHKSVETQYYGQDYVGSFRSALERYRAAKARCDGPGMMAARAEMDAAQATVRQMLGKATAEGQSELLKKLAEERKAVENGTISMCPSLTPTLAHMLSEPPRVSSEPMSDEEVADQEKALASTASHPTSASRATTGAGASLLCAGPGLEGFGEHARPMPPAGVMPDMATEGADVGEYGSIGPMGAMVSTVPMSPMGPVGSEGSASSEDVPACPPGVFQNCGEAQKGMLPKLAKPEPKAPDEEWSIQAEMKYDLDGRKCGPQYQETKVPQPPLPNGEMFPPKK